MLGNEYRAFVGVMSTNSKGERMPLEIAALGLAGEAAECVGCHYNSDELWAEMGDCVFYITSLCEQLGVSDEDLTAHSVAIVRNFDETPQRVARDCQLALPKLACHVAEMVKKQAWHGREYTTQRYAQELGYMLRLVAYIAENVMHCTLAQCIQANRTKLESRWPQWFGVQS